MGAILAYSSRYPYTVLSRWLGNRRGVAALIFVLLAFVVVLGPFVYAGASVSAHIDGCRPWSTATWNTACRSFPTG